MTSVIKEPKQFRTNIRNKCFPKLVSEKSRNNMETGIYNWTLKEATYRKVIKRWDNPQFVILYKDKLRSILNNLNNEVVVQINNDSIKSQTVAFMTHQELKPDHWGQLIDMKIKRNKHKYENNMEAATDTFTCRKCKKNECTYYQMQTRSADEPMTTFVSCINCGNRWKC